MKIVLIIDAWEPIIGGGQKLFKKITTGLVKDHGCQIHIITRALINDQGKKFTQNQSLLGGRLLITRLGPPAKWGNIFYRLWFTFQSAIFALKQKPDIYLASTFLPSFTLKIIKLFKKTPQALVVIGFGAQNCLYRLLEKLITHTFNYDLLITDDYQYFNKIKPQKNIRFIPNGVTIPKLEKIEKFKPFTFLFIGRNEPRKGVNYLKTAFQKLKKIYPQSQLIIIGPGFKIVPLKKLKRLLLKSHILVIPSLKEGHPLVLFEAFAHRLPVIATSVGSIPQFVNSKNGYLVKPQSSKALLKAMEKAINNPKLSELGQNGYQMVKKQFSWPKTIKKYYLAFTSLLQ